MSEQSIVERILYDADMEARTVISEAEKKAAETVALASERAKRNKEGALAEAKEKATAILDGKAASARLECSKILLGEKRSVIDAVYLRALKQLNALNKTESVRLAEGLLTQYAEAGDEIVFAENYSFAPDVSKLSVVRERKLKVSSKTANLDGGFILRGKDCDKNISYGALLAEDREKHQSEIAAKLFITG